MTVAARSPGWVRSTRIFPGWIVVGAGFAVLFVAYGLQFSFGVFVRAIGDDVGWTRTQLSVPYAMYVLIYSGVSSLSGYATDRRGPRVVVLAGGALLGIGYAAFGAAQSLWQVYLVFGLVAGLGMSASWVPINATVVRWFTRRRGLAVGITSTGGSAGNLVVPPIVAALIAAVGWRSTMVAMGLFAAVAMALCSRFLVRDPETLGLLPDGERATAPAPAATGAGTEGTAPEAPFPAPAASVEMTLGEARRTATFWALFSIFSLNWIVVFVPFLHLAPFAEDLGATTLSAALVISAIGLGGVLGRLIVGWASDRVGRRQALAAMFVLQVASFAVFAVSGGVGLLYPAAVAFGFSYGGAVTLFPAVVGDVFGRVHAGAIVGTIFAVAGSMAAIGPFVAGAIYDATGGYRLAFGLSAACNVVALGLVATLPAQRVRT